MHLLNANTLKLETFLDRAKTPAYAILSHTWGDEEVLYDDVKYQPRSDYSARNGFAKIEYTCQQAIKDDLDYVWIDTACIDKKSSAELSEAINSMFAWYREAKVCYAYLNDVSVISEESGVLAAPKLPPSTIISFNVADLTLQSRQFVSSRWFTRGWTLQELLAPSHIIFFDRSWICLGSLQEPTTKDQNLDAVQLTRPEADISSLISHATRIPILVVAKREDFSHSSVAKRFSWAASRQTTRQEDEAYSLLGIFDVNMSLLYGEGPQAFQRLQREVAQRSNDHTLFAWARPRNSQRTPCYMTEEPSDRMLFAPSLDRFHPCHYLGRKIQVSVFDSSMDTMPYDVKKSGIEITLPLHYCISPFYAIAVLQCFDERRANDPIYLVLNSVSYRSSGPQRAFQLISSIKTPADIRFRPRAIHINEYTEECRNAHERLYLKLSATKDLSLKATQVFPEAMWDDSTSSCNLRPLGRRAAIIDITHSTTVTDPFSTKLPQQSYQIYIVVASREYNAPFELGIGPYQGQDLAVLCSEAEVEEHMSSCIHPVAKHLFVEAEFLQGALRQPPTLAINIAHDNLKFARSLSRVRLLWDFSMLPIRHPLLIARASMLFPLKVLPRTGSWLLRKAHLKGPTILYRSGLVDSQHHENPTRAKAKRLIVEEMESYIEEFKRVPLW